MDDDPPDKYIITQKDRLDNVMKDFSYLSDPKLLTDVIFRVNDINMHTYNATKGFFLDKFEKDTNFPFTDKDYYPKLDEQFIRTIMNAITSKKEKRGKIENKKDLYVSINNFVDEHYKPLLINTDIVCRDKLKHFLNYEEKMIVTNVKNNIKEHYISHLKFFIRIYFGIDKDIERIKKESKNKSEDIKNINKKFNNLVTDILNYTGTDYKSKKKYHNEITYLNLLLVPQKLSFMKKSVEYDVKARPLDYLPNLIAMNRELEQINSKLKEGVTPYKLFNVLPLKRSLVPKYITIDTTCLITLFIRHYNGLLMRLEKHPLIRKMVWDLFFDLNKPVFQRKGFTFNYRIQTDGIACSVSMIRTDKNGNAVEKIDSYTQKQNNRLTKAISEKYIDEITITSDLLDRAPAFLDVGKKELFQAMIETGIKEDKYKFFAYSRCKRNRDTKAHRYDEIRSELANTKIGTKTVKEIESKLSDYNSKSANLVNFKKYLRVKIVVNRLLRQYYQNITFRRLIWNTHNNTRRSEDLMIERFKKTMGGPDKTYIILGDYSDLGLKGSKSSMTKGIRRIFQSHGYDVFLIDEFKTSKVCSCCGGEVENFVMRRKGKYAGKLVWKLVRCKICKSIHNRDHNATKNFSIITKCHLSGKSRPDIYKRPLNQENKINMRRALKKAKIEILKKIKEETHGHEEKHR